MSDTYGEGEDLSPADIYILKSQLEWYQEERDRLIGVNDQLNIQLKLFEKSMEFEQQMEVEQQEDSPDLDDSEYMDEYDKIINEAQLAIEKAENRINQFESLEPPQNNQSLDDTIENDPIPPQQAQNIAPKPQTTTTVKKDSNPEIQTQPKQKAKDLPPIANKPEQPIQDTKQKTQPKSTPPAPEPTEKKQEAPSKNTPEQQSSEELPSEIQQIEAKLKKQAPVNKAKATEPPTQKAKPDKMIEKKSADQAQAAHNKVSGSTKEEITEEDSEISEEIDALLAEEPTEDQK